MLKALSRLFGAGGPGKKARRLEAAGRLEEATAAYLEAGERAEATRLLSLRADSEPDANRRLRLLGQAVALAEGEGAADIRRRRARLCLELVKLQSLQLVPSELSELGLELEALGEPALAAEAFSRAGDVDAQARALVAAGAIDRLEQVLEAQQDRVREERRKDALSRRVQDLELAGRRREALEAARIDARSDPRLEAVVRAIEARRAEGPRVRLSLDGEPLEVLFGDQVMIGRAGADLVVASPSVSREHLLVRRGARGPEVVDQGSRNGTLLGGARIDVPVSVGAGLELELGGEVRLQIAPWQGGVKLEVAGQCVHAPLGPLTLDGWSLELASDRWLELEARGPGPLLSGLRVDQRIQLCRGDRLTEEVGGKVRLEVLA